MRKILGPLLAGLLLSSGAGAAPVIVGPNDPNWQILVTDNTGIGNTGSGSGQFVFGPATPPAGSGSFNFFVPTGDQTVQLRTTLFSGTLLSTLTTLSYSTFATQIGGLQLPFLTLYVDQDTTLGGLQFDRLFFEPVYSTSQSGDTPTVVPEQPDIALNTWQTWDVLNGAFYSDSSAARFTFAEYLTAFPTAGLTQDPLQGGTMRFVSGLSSNTDSYNTYVDNFSFNSTTFDFEVVPELDPSSASLPTIFSFLGVLVLCSRKIPKQVKR